MNIIVFCRLAELPVLFHSQHMDTLLQAKNKITSSWVTVFSVAHVPLSIQDWSAPSSSYNLWSLNPFTKNNIYIAQFCKSSFGIWYKLEAIQYKYSYQQHGQRLKLADSATLTLLSSNWSKKKSLGFTQAPEAKNTELSQANEFHVCVSDALWLKHIKEASKVQKRDDSDFSNKRRWCFNTFLWV